MSSRPRQRRGRPKPPRRPDFRWPTAAESTTDAADLARQGRELGVELAVDMAAAVFTQPDQTPTTVPELGRRAIVGHLHAKLLEHIEADRMAMCEHLEADGGDAMWLPHIPNALLCGACLAGAPRPMDCSHCGGHVPFALERWLVTAGPTTIVAFLCPRCVSTARPEAVR